MTTATFKQLELEAKYIAERLNLKWYGFGKYRHFYYFEYMKGFRHKIKGFSTLKGLREYIKDVYDAL
jgi:hypothetical protein